MKRRVVCILVFLTLLIPGLIWAGGSGERDGLIPLRVMIVEQATVPKDEGSIVSNPWTEYVQQEMAKQGIGVRFVSIGGSQVNHTIMMATNTAPDIAFTHGRLLFTKFAIDGGLRDLGPYLEEYGPNITRVLGEEVLQYGRIDGNQYAIPGYRGEVARNSSFIREDWLEAVGMEAPTNRDELTNVLRAFRRENPGEIDEAKLAPWGWFSDDPGTIFDSDFKLFDVMYSFLGHDVELNYTKMWPERDGFRDFMEWLNTLYAEGLIEREFATDSFAIKTRKVINGEVGFVNANWAYPYGQSSTGVQTNLAQNVPGARLVPINVFANAENEYWKLRYLPVNHYVFNPERSRQPEAAVGYLNWVLEDEVAWTLTFGREGEQHVIQDGMPVVTDLQTFEDSFGYVDQSLRVLDDYPFDQEIVDFWRNQLRAYDFGGLDDLSREMALEPSFLEPVFQERLGSMSRFGPGLIKIAEKYWVKLITEEDFDAGYAEFIEKLNDRGMAEIAAERREYYNRNLR